MPVKPTIADVAEAAGVHKATASRALNPATEHMVNASTAKRVHRAAKRVGYIPNLAARSLRTSQSMTIGVIVPDLENPIFPPVVRGVEKYLAPRGYTTLVANTDGSPEVENTVMQTLLQRNVDGCIFATAHIDDELLMSINDRGVRAVLVLRGTGHDMYPLVNGDDAEGIEAAVEHLRDLGHRRILHIAGPTQLTTSEVRREAFERAAGRHADLVTSIVESDAYAVSAGHECIERVLDSTDPRPTAIVAANDLLAIGAVRSLREHGLSCPADMSIVGFNDMPFAQDFNPALTTVRVPFAEMGFEAARLLIDSLSGTDVSRRTLTLPTQLIARDSTRALAD